MSAFEYIRELTRAEGFMELSMPEDALRILDELPISFRTRPEVILLRVRILLFLGKKQAAEALAERMVACNPQSGDALFCLAMAQAQMGKRIAARNSLNAAFVLNATLRLAAEEVLRVLRS